MWKQIPGYARVCLVIFGMLYAAVTIDLLFWMPLLGIVMVAALVWVSWSIFSLIGLLGAVKSGKLR